jgi:hypothetical protein
MNVTIHPAKLVNPAQGACSQNRTNLQGILQFRHTRMQRKPWCASNSVSLWQQIFPLLALEDLVGYPAAHFRTFGAALEAKLGWLVPGHRVEHPFHPI